MTFMFRLVHDFNEGRNEGGFHEVLLPAHLEGNFHRGDSVIVTDGEIEVRGRIRGTFAVVEDAEPASGSAGGATKPQPTLGNRPDVATPRVAKATRGAKGTR